MATDFETEADYRADLRQQATKATREEPCNDYTRGWIAAWAEVTRVLDMQDAVAAQVAAMSDAGSTPGPEKFLVRKGTSFYKAGCCGYTSDIRRAGRFTAEEARAHAAREPWHMEAIPVSSLPPDPRLETLIRSVHDVDGHHLTKQEAAAILVAIDAASAPLP